MVDVAPIFTAGTNNPIDANTSSLVASGCDTSAPTTTDWYVHTQAVEIMYLRNDAYTTGGGACVRPLNGPPAPYVSHNFLDANIRVQTTDRIMYNATFSSCAQVPQQLLFIASAACSGGFGIYGTVDTCVVGVIRRPARKDAAGTILDPTGVCDVTYNENFDKAPGAYDCTNGFDTSATRNPAFRMLLANMGQDCPTFDPNLVDL